MNPLLKDILQLLIPAAMTAYAILLVTREKTVRNEKDEDKLEERFQQSSKEFTQYIHTLNIAMEKQAVVQALTAETLKSILNKMEEIESKVFESAEKFAVLKARCEERHGTD